MTPGAERGPLLAPGAAALDAVERRKRLARWLTLATCAVLAACGALLLCSRHPLEASKIQFFRAPGPSSADAATVDNDDNTAADLSKVDVPRAGKPHAYPSWWNETSQLPNTQPTFIHIPKTGGVSVEDSASKSGHTLGACVVHSLGDAALPYPLAPG
jgi:hypothetical protein